MNTDTLQKSTPSAGPNGEPDSFEESLKLAFEMHNAGRCEEAEALCRVLEKIHPRNSQLLFLLGMVLHKTGQDEEAVQWLDRAAQHRPGSARIYNGLGCACQGVGDHARAAAAFEKALELQPESADVFYNLGKSCYRLDQVDRATELFRRAVKINPHDANSWNNLGKCLKELNRLDESIAAYNRAVEIMPDYALAHYGRAISLMAAGRLLEGFREYEWRWHSMTPRKFPQPAWQGENAPGKTLLVHAEQGFGDAIQMVRFISAARERMGRVILECRPELTTLFQYAKCADVIIPHGAAIPPFDYFVPLMSLPRALGVTLDTIPAPTPYLQAPAHEGLPAAPVGCLKVGLAWAGNPHHHQDAARSLPLEALAPVLQVPDVAFYSLQASVPKRDESCLRSLSHVIHSDLRFKDFLDTASVIAEMHLVITVDTAVAHLAGALAKPTWMLVQHSPDWRWFLDRADTPWYPTMQLFRQAKRGHWEMPIQRVVDALRRLAGSTEVPIDILHGLQTILPAHNLAAT
jgi:tetratricopeptide (TPR) repeat protein